MSILCADYFWVRAHQAFPSCTCHHHHDTTARTCTVTCDLQCVFLPLHTLS